METASGQKFEVILWSKNSSSNIVLEALYNLTQR